MKLSKKILLIFEGTPSQKPKYPHILKKLGYRLKNKDLEYNNLWLKEYIWEKRIGNFKIIVKESYRYPGLFRIYLNEVNDVTSCGDMITESKSNNNIDEDGSYFKTSKKFKNFLIDAENKVKSNKMFKNISKEEYEEQRRNAIEIVSSYYLDLPKNCIID